MFGIGYQELMVILVIVLVLFGGRKRPDWEKARGRQVKEFKRGIGPEPEEEQMPKPQPAVSASPVPPRVCSSCGSPLEAAWSHCPRCGTWAAQGPTSTPPK